MTVHETHQRLFRLLIQHGTEEEKRAAKEASETMLVWRESFPGSSWEPIEEVTLPSFLIGRCVRVAKERQASARRFSLENKHGVRRTLEEETRSVQGQYAACLMLGLEFGAAHSHRSAKAHGNLGAGLSSFTPSPGNYGLVIGEKEPPARRFFLVAETGTNTFACGGWVRVGEVARDEYQRTFVRDGVSSHPYIVPPDMLHPLREWFG